MIRKMYLKENSNAANLLTDLVLHQLQFEASLSNAKHPYLSLHRKFI